MPLLEQSSSSLPEAEEEQAPAPPTPPLAAVPSSPKGVKFWVPEVDTEHHTDTDYSISQDVSTHLTDSFSNEAVSSALAARDIGQLSADVEDLE